MTRLDAFMDNLRTLFFLKLFCYSLLVFHLLFAAVLVWHAITSSWRALLVMGIPVGCALLLRWVLVVVRELERDLKKKAVAQ